MRKSLNEYVEILLESNKSLSLGWRWTTVFESNSFIIFIKITLSIKNKVKFLGSLLKPINSIEHKYYIDYIQKWIVKLIFQFMIKFLDTNLYWEIIEINAYQTHFCWSLMRHKS